MDPNLPYQEQFYNVGYQDQIPAAVFPGPGPNASYQNPVQNTVFQNHIQTATFQNQGAMFANQSQGAMFQNRAQVPVLQNLPQGPILQNQGQGQMFQNTIPNVMYNGQIQNLAYQNQGQCEMIRVNASNMNIQHANLNPRYLNYTRPFIQPRFMKKPTSYQVQASVNTDETTEPSAITAAISQQTSQTLPEAACANTHVPVTSSVDVCVSTTAVTSADSAATHRHTVHHTGDAGKLPSFNQTFDHSLSISQQSASRSVSVPLNQVGNPTNQAFTQSQQQHFRNRSQNNAAMYGYNQNDMVGYHGVNAMFNPADGQMNFIQPAPELKMYVNNPTKNVDINMIGGLSELCYQNKRTSYQMNAAQAAQPNVAGNSIMFRQPVVNVPQQHAAYTNYHMQTQQYFTNPPSNMPISIITKRQQHPNVNVQMMQQSNRPNVSGYHPLRPWGDPSNQSQDANHMIQQQQQGFPNQHYNSAHNMSFGASRQRFIHQDHYPKQPTPTMQKAYAPASTPTHQQQLYASTGPFMNQQLHIAQAQNDSPALHVHSHLSDPPQGFRHLYAAQQNCPEMYRDTPPAVSDPTLVPTSACILSRSSMANVITTATTVCTALPTLTSTQTSPEQLTKSVCDGSNTSDKTENASSRDSSATNKTERSQELPEDPTAVTSPANNSAICEPNNPCVPCSPAMRKIETNQQQQPDVQVSLLSQNSTSGTKTETTAAAEVSQLSPTKLPNSSSTNLTGNNANSSPLRAEFSGPCTSVSGLSRVATTTSVTMTHCQLTTSLTNPVTSVSASVVSKCEAADNSVPIVPFGWRRVIEGGQVIYYSPSDSRISSLQNLRHYLLMDGTCKCGLDCPLNVAKVFTFDPTVNCGKCTADMLVHTAGMSKLCSHSRKITALAALQCGAWSAQGGSWSAQGGAWSAHGQRMKMDNLHRYPQPSHSADLVVPFDAGLDYSPLLSPTSSRTVSHKSLEELHAPSGQATRARHHSDHFVHNYNYSSDYPTRSAPMSQMRHAFPQFDANYQQGVSNPRFFTHEANFQDGVSRFQFQQNLQEFGVGHQVAPFGMFIPGSVATLNQANMINPEQLVPNQVMPVPRFPNAVYNQMTPQMGGFQRAVNSPMSPLHNNVVPLQTQPCFKSGSLPSNMAAGADMPIRLTSSSYLATSSSVGAPNSSPRGWFNKPKIKPKRLRNGKKSGTKLCSNLTQRISADSLPKMASFMDNPAAFLAQQTAMVQNSIACSANGDRAETNKLKTSEPSDSGIESDSKDVSQDDIDDSGDAGSLCAGDMNSCKGDTTGDSSSDVSGDKCVDLSSGGNSAADVVKSSSTSYITNPYPASDLLSSAAVRAQVANQYAAPLNSVFMPNQSPATASANGNARVEVNSQGTNTKIALTRRQTPIEMVENIVANLGNSGYSYRHKLTEGMDTGLGRTVQQDHHVSQSSSLDCTDPTSQHQYVSGSPRQPNNSQTNASSTPQMNASSTPQMNTSSTPQINASNTPQMNACSTPQMKTSTTPQTTTSSTPQMNASSTPQMNTSSTPQTTTSSTPRTSTVNEFPITHTSVNSASLQKASIRSDPAPTTISYAMVQVSNTVTTNSIVESQPLSSNTVTLSTAYAAASACHVSRSSDTIPSSKMDRPTSKPEVCLTDPRPLSTQPVMDASVPQFVYVPQVQMPVCQLINAGPVASNPVCPSVAPASDTNYNLNMTPLIMPNQRVAIAGISNAVIPSDMTCENMNVGEGVVCSASPGNAVSLLTDLPANLTPPTTTTDISLAQQVGVTATNFEIGTSGPATFPVLVANANNQTGIVPSSNLITAQQGNSPGSAMSLINLQQMMSMFSTQNVTAAQLHQLQCLQLQQQLMNQVQYMQALITQLGIQASNPMANIATVAFPTEQKDAGKPGVSLGEVMPQVAPDSTHDLLVTEPGSSVENESDSQVSEQENVAESVEYDQMNEEEEDTSDETSQDTVINEDFSADDLSESHFKSRTRSDTCETKGKAEAQRTVAPMVGPDAAVSGASLATVSSTHNAPARKDSSAGGMSERIQERAVTSTIPAVCSIDTGVTTAQHLNPESHKIVTADASLLAAPTPETSSAGGEVALADAVTRGAKLDATSTCEPPAVDRRILKRRFDIKRHAGASDSDDAHPPSSSHEFSEGDLVWGQTKGYQSWPGKVIRGSDDNKECLVCWFGDHSVVAVSTSKLQTLSEGLEAQHSDRQTQRKTKKLNPQLSAAIQEAMTELDSLHESHPSKKKSSKKSRKSR